MVGDGTDVVEVATSHLKHAEYIWLAPMGRLHPGEALSTADGAWQKPPKGEEGPFNLLGTAERPLPPELRHEVYSRGVRSGAIIMAIKSGKPLILVFFAGMQNAMVNATSFGSRSIGIFIGDPIEVEVEDFAAAQDPQIGIQPATIQKYKQRMVDAINALGDASRDLEDFVPPSQ